MGQMHTDMLEVLTEERAEIAAEVVGMQALALNVDHRAGLRVSGVKLLIDPMPPALGDLRLIKQALSKLMENA